jgi:hypothetical protein
VNGTVAIADELPPAKSHYRPESRVGGPGLLQLDVTPSYVLNVLVADDPGVMYRVGGHFSGLALYVQVTRTGFRASGVIERTDPALATYSVRG